MTDVLDTNGLVERVARDPFAFVKRVLQEVLDQLVHDGTAAGNGHKPPEEAVAATLGGQLAQMIESWRSSSDGPRTGFRGEGSSLYPEFAQRNAALAAALGACDCWGLSSDCPVCDGVGVPGWMLPERRLFAWYVLPAVRAVAKSRGSVAGRTGNERKEGGEGGYADRIMAAVPMTGGSSVKERRPEYQRKEGGDASHVAR